MWKGFQEGEIIFNLGANFVIKVVSNLGGTDWRTQHLDAERCTRKSETKTCDKRDERVLSKSWAPDGEVFINDTPPP